MEKIKELAENIYHHKTKEYFNEVLSSFENENYRSCIVMLYSVVICDLVFKLTDLKEIHNDTKAERILSDLKAGKEEDPVSPEWESKLIEKSFKEAKILENDVYTHIDTLKKYRNLSAHPVLNSMDILFKPNKEWAESMNINLLEGLLTKPPTLTKNVFSPFMEEIERIKNEFSNTERLKTYLESKFFIHFNKELTEYIFKQLWKAAFKSSGERETQNREANYKVLIIIYQKYQDALFDSIKKQASFFSQFLDEETVITKLLDFLGRYPEIFHTLEDHCKELLKTHVSKDIKKKIKAVFISDSLKDHLKSIDSEIHSVSYAMYNQPYIQDYKLKHDEVNFLYEVATKEKCTNEFYDLMISHYYHSGSFDDATSSFKKCIEPFYKDFNREHFEILLKEANKNDQCYEGRNGDRNMVLLEPAKELMPEVNFEETYGNLF